MNSSNYDSISEDTIPQDIRNILDDPSADYADEKYLERLLYSAYGRVMHWPALTAAISRRLRKHVGEPSLETQPPEVASASNILARDACIEFDQPGLSSEKVSEILDYLLRKPCYNGHIATDARDKDKPRYFGYGAEDYSFASYSDEDIFQCPHLLELATDPFLLSLAETHLGVTPTMSACQLWWTLPKGDYKTGSSYAPTNWHRDLNDFGMFWIYVYLTDVNEVSAPHQILCGTHQWSIVRNSMKRLEKDNQDPRIASLKIEELFDQFGYQHHQDLFEILFGDRMKTITGEAGKLFLSDGLAFHRAGVSTSHSPRLIFAARYSLCPIVGATDERPKIPATSLNGRIDDSPKMRYATRKIFNWDAPGTVAVKWPQLLPNANAEPAETSRSAPAQKRHAIPQKLQGLGFPPDVLKLRDEVSRLTKELEDYKYAFETTRDDRDRISKELQDKS